VRAAKRADVYLANSTEVRGRIQRRYGRDAQVVPAPIPERIAHAAGHQDHGSGHNPEPGFYLCVSRLLPYKHVDAVVGAFADLPDRRLVVVGSGPLESDLIASAGPNVTFVKDITDDALTRLYTDARALIAVAYEDYGLTPVEAAVTGTPCIVLRWGGYLDTMVEDVTATFIEEPTPADIGDGIARFEQRTWDREVIRAHSDAFTEKVFIGTLHELVRHEAEQVR
jgi:glycosyltransferase involved in cell wall biosynthesis